MESQNGWVVTCMPAGQVLDGREPAMDCGGSQVVDGRELAVDCGGGSEWMTGGEESDPQVEVGQSGGRQACRCGYRRA